jgi:hypothetical protein
MLAPFGRAATSVFKGSVEGYPAVQRCQLPPMIVLVLVLVVVLDFIYAEEAS